MEFRKFPIWLFYYYSGNNIGDEGAKYLSNTLQYNASLLVLVLSCFLFWFFHYYSGNNIGTEGARYLSNALQYNASLLALNLWGFQFDSFIIIQGIILEMKEQNIFRIH